jgi:hypothetical protein
MVTKRLEVWLPDMVAAYNTQAIDQALYHMIREQFAGRFAAEQMALIRPGFDAAQALIGAPSMEPDDAEMTSDSLVGLF